MTIHRVGYCLPPWLRDEIWSRNTGEETTELALFFSVGFSFAWVWPLECQSTVTDLRHCLRTAAREKLRFQGSKIGRKGIFLLRALHFCLEWRAVKEDNTFLTWFILQHWEALKIVKNKLKYSTSQGETFHIVLVPFQPGKLSQILKCSQAATRAVFAKELCSPPAWHFWKSRYWFWCLNGSWALLQICFWSCTLSCSANSGYHCSAFLYFLVVSCAGSKTIKAPQGNHSCSNQEAWKISGAKLFSLYYYLGDGWMSETALSFYGSELCHGRCYKNLLKRDNPSNE